MMVLWTTLTTLFVSLLFLFVGFGCSTSTENAQHNDNAKHVDPSMASRIFPAAQREIYEEDSHVLGILHAFKVEIQALGPDSINVIMEPAIQRFQTALQTKLPDFADEYPPRKYTQTHDMERIEIRVQSPKVDLYQGVDESYTIIVDDLAPTVILSAPTVFGALHALETLSQLLVFGWLSSDKKEPIYTMEGLPIMIGDEPHFAYRGLMIDTSRHYLPLNLILHNLDVMAMNKLNILHWHLTDSQSFPLSTPNYPELAQKGAYHPKLIYTSKDIQTIIQEAYLRGIRVIPEVDMPGHTQSIGNSHPELMSHCPDASQPLDPTNPDVYDFVQGIYQDLGGIFSDEYVHVGGDEVRMDCWNQSKNISDWMIQHNMTSPVELYEYFETKLLHVVQNQGKTPIVWQEVFNLNLTISNETIVDVWKGFDQKTIENAVNQSYRVVLSGCWYLDWLKETWQSFYECDPSNFTGDPSLMLGGHASMWGEHVDASNFMSRVWPRASSAAERLWTGDVTNARQNLEERIHKFRCRLVQQGFAAGPTGPGFCPHEVPYHDNDVSKKNNQAIVDHGISADQ